jgi:hypothetical protein
MAYDFAVTNNDAEFAAFRVSMAAKMREIADDLESGNNFVAVVLATCDYDGCGGPLVMLDGNAATVELVDEIVDTVKNAMFEAL